MGEKSRFAGMAVVSMVLLAGAAGCTVSIQPWTKAVGPPPALELGAPGPAQFPMPNGGPPRPVMPPASNETISVMIKQYHEVDEQRRALLDQVEGLRRQLKDRDSSLRHASHEVEESTKQLKRTRDDFRQWQLEMEELRDRMRKLEEGRATLKPLVEELLQRLERRKDL